MKKLIFVPIIHMSVDLGSIAEQVNKKGIAALGEEFWKKHRETVSGLWDSIIKYFSGLEVKNFKLYQDGMVADGEVGQKIVNEVARAGSKNYEVIEDLLRRGAILVQTENFTLVKKERDRIIKITLAKTISEKLIAYLKYRLTKNRLLDKRDDYIAKRINETLKDGETGILFIGAYHNIKKKLAKNICVKEIKDARKLKEYQGLLPFYNKHKRRFEKLSGYLISKVEV